MYEKIYDVDTPEEAAKKIYRNFEAGQSCKILGIIDGEEKGKIVIAEIKRLYENEHVYPYKGKLMRILKYPKDSIGGAIAHPIFKWIRHQVCTDGKGEYCEGEVNNVRYTIWKIQ